MNKLTNLLIITFSALLLLSGCSTDVEDTAGTDYLLAGYYMIAGDETPLTDDVTGTSRATVPVYNAPWDTFTYAQWIAGSANGNKINNYPERGQKTNVTVTEYDAANNVYFISSRTEYPNQEELIDYYLEEYYVQDVTPGDPNTPDGIWDESDPTVTFDGTTWNTDNFSRETMQVVFQDGSIRYEWIADVHDTAGGNASYAMFDINGDMAFPSVAYSPATDPDAAWSSKVYYYQKIETWISWFYKENKETFGVRYFTYLDDGDSNGWPSSTLAFEHTVTREVPTWADSDWGELLDWLFGGTSSDGSVSGDTLAETVIREQIETNGKKTTVSSTTIVPTFGEAFTIDKSMEYNL